MKERPILYSTPMAQAKRARIKTQTRRTKGLEEINKTPGLWDLVHIGFYKANRVNGKKMDSFGALFQHKEFTHVVIDVPCGYGKPGDILWGRETLVQEGELGLKYFADNDHIDNDTIPEYHKPYRNYAFCNIPSIHMPKYLARLWDRVTEIRVERLQDISDYDARCEGHDILLHGEDSLAWYKKLWESINGPGSWELNPWVWVIKTEILSTTGRPEGI